MSRDEALNAAAQNILMALAVAIASEQGRKTRLEGSGWSNTGKVNGRLLSELWAFDALPEATRSTFSGRQLRITVNRSLSGYPPDFLLAVLAHGLQMAVDRDRLGPPRTDEECVERQIRAYETQAALWPDLRGRIAGNWRSVGLFQGLEDSWLLVRSYPRQLVVQLASAYLYQCD